jgi:hypothetical protein
MGGFSGRGVSNIPTSLARFRIQNPFTAPATPPPATPVDPMQQQTAQAGALRRYVDRD